MATARRRGTKNTTSTKKKAPARRTRKAATAATGDTDLIVDNAVEDELADSFLEYSLAVIISRAIPDARDGLKPVQRRVLYSMLESGLRSDRPHRKSVSAVGDTMKNYHPHGDSSIYETLVRMAQDWSLRVPLIDGHGNFGSMDDPPAAYRYTEARLAPTAEALLADVDEGTVEMAPNFDQTRDEPTVLPAAFPNLLVNGAVGIAVGMATDIPPHNLAEVAAAAKVLLARPKATLDELMEALPGPDYPTGGLAIGLEGIRDAYETGRGRYLLRARARVEDLTARRRGIVITELPYNVGPEKVIAKVKEVVQAKRVDGIADIKDFSDHRRGLQLVIECKAGFDPDAVLAALYKLTPLQVSVNVNAVALVDGKPEQCNLRRLLATFIAHRVEVVVARTRTRLERAEARAHIVQGLLLALDQIDEVIAILRAAKDAERARAALMRKLKISQVQATHILDMPLRRLTGLEATKLRGELTALEREMKALSRILGSPKRQREVIAGELDELVARFGTPRRTTLHDHGEVTEAAAPPAADPATALELPDEPCQVVATAAGTLLRAAGDRPAKGRHVAVSWCETTTRSHVAAVTASGRAALVPVAELPEMSPSRSKAAPGAPAGEFVDLEGGDRVVAVVPVGAPIAMMTRGGVVKRLAADGWPSATVLERAGHTGAEIIGLTDSDQVCAAVPCTDDDHLVAVSSAAQLLRFPAGSVRPQGRAAAGMAGMRLQAGDHVVAFAAMPAEAPEAGWVVAVCTDAGNAKVSDAHDYPAKGRGTGGVRCVTFKKADSALAAAAVVAAGGDPSGLIAATDAGEIVELPAELARRDASGTPVAAAVAHIGPPAS